MLDSSSDTVAILYDIENAPIEMLQYTIDIAQRYQPCRMIVVSDWEAHPDQKRWDRLMESPDFTFRQISRTFLGKNSLDSALYDSAQILYQEGVRKYFIITTDSDFVRIAESLNSEDPSYIIGIGTKQASEDLRNAYNEFFVYPPPTEAEQEAAAIQDPQERLDFLNERPDREDVRMVVGVLRTGESWCAVRSRSRDSSDQVMNGEALVPGLVEALSSTLV